MLSDFAQGRPLATVLISQATTTVMGSAVGNGDSFTCDNDSGVGLGDSHCDNDDSVVEDC